MNRVIHHSRIFSHLGPAYLRPCRMSCQMSDYEILVMCYAKHEEPCARYHRGILRVNFIIKSGLIRGKPSCAATWTKSFASAEIADSRQILDFQILDPSICAAQTLSHSLLKPLLRRANGESAESPSLAISQCSSSDGGSERGCR